MKSYFPPFHGPPLSPLQLVVIADAYREVLLHTGLGHDDPAAAVLAARAVRLYQHGIRERRALVRILLRLQRRPMAARHQRDLGSTGYVIHLRF